MLTHLSNAEAFQLPHSLYGVKLYTPYMHVHIHTCKCMGVGFSRDRSTGVKMSMLNSTQDQMGRKERKWPSHGGLFVAAIKKQRGRRTTARRRVLEHVCLSPPFPLFSKKVHLSLKCWQSIAISSYQCLRGACSELPACACVFVAVVSCSCSCICGFVLECF